MRLIFIFILLSNLIPSQLSAQANQIDSLKRLSLKSSLNDSLYSNVTSDLMDEYSFLNLYSECRKVFLEASSKLEKNGNFKRQSYVIARYGYALITLKRYAEAKKWLNKAYSLAKKQEYEIVMIYAQTTLGNLYYNLNELDKAKKYFLQAKQISDRKKELKKTSIDLTVNIAVIYAVKGEYDLAEIQFKKYLEYTKNDNNKLEIALALNNLAELHLNSNHYQKAYFYGKQAFEIKLAHGNIIDKITAYHNYASIVSKAKGNREAIELLEKSIQLHKEKYLLQLLNTYQLLNDLYEENEEYKNAYFTNKNVAIIRDSINLSEELKQIEISQLKNDIATKNWRDSLVNHHEKTLQKEQIHKKQTQNYFLLLGLLLTVFFGYILFRRLKFTQKQKSIIDQQKEIVEQRNQEITDSISYAKQIQAALLTSETFIAKYFPNSSLFFAPKDIVSGDFYYATITEESLYLAICDCTGHGVPGAFMSILNINYLNQAILQNKLKSPAEIFNFIRESVIKALPNSNDGMDGTLLRFSLTNDQIDLSKPIVYCSAHNAPIILQKNQISTGEKDKMPVGKFLEVNKGFNEFELKLNEGDVLLLTSDGFPDQFGGINNKKFKLSNLEKLLQKLYSKEQRNITEELQLAFNDWKGEADQIDDVCVFTFKPEFEKSSSN